MKKLALLLTIFMLNFNLLAQHAVKISSGTGSFIDPEILNSEKKLAFQTESGEVWLSDIDPRTGLFLTPSGKDLRVDSGTAPLVQSFNGPEFGVDQDGWAIFYTKKHGLTPQPWKAIVQDNAVVSTEGLTTGNIPRLSILASKDSTAAGIRLLFSKGATLNTGVFAWTPVNNPGNETVVDSTDRGVRWIDGTRKFVYLKQTGSQAGQLFLYDTDTQTEIQITNDSRSKSFSYGWFVPEYDSQLGVLALLDHDTKLGIYQDTGRDYWELVREIGIPDSAKYSYFGSPEPFVAAGKSYISCIIKEMPDSYANSEVWIFNIQEGPNFILQRRIDDGLGEVIRSDPEVFLGENEVFVYYNVIANNKFDIYRGRTGLLTLNQENLETHIIQPVATDNKIDGHNEPHYILLNHGVPSLNKIPLYFPGTNARPFDYLKFVKTAADLGYYAISLSYENLNSVNLQICNQSTDTTCHRRARYENWFGVDTHESLNINFDNSIINRLTKLLFYLAEHYPRENWSSFLMADHQIDWSKIVVAGHSQGGGHASFASKLFQVDKVIMIAASDWVNGQTADWIRTPGPTAAEKYYGFIHEQDVPAFRVIRPTWNDFGMFQFGLPVNVDQNQPPYNYSHALITNLPVPEGIRPHNYLIVDHETPATADYQNYLYSDAWKYLLANEPRTRINTGKAVTVIQFELYQNHPNPFNPSTRISFQLAGTSHVTLKIFDARGREVATLADGAMTPGKHAVTFSPRDLASGIYFYRLTAGQFSQTRKAIFIK